MATLTGRTIASSYTELLKTTSASGITSSLDTVQDGDATDSALQLSSAGVKSTGTFEVTGTATLSTSVVLATGATVTGIDDGDLTTGSATLLATQGAIKTYVDAQVGATNELSEVLAAGNTTGASNIVVDDGQKITTDTIDETTAAAGVTIDGVVMKDTAITTGAWTATAVADEYGGTGQTTYAQGDILVATATDTLSKLTIGTENSILTSGAADVSWAASFTGNVTGDLTGTADVATKVTVTDNEDTDEENLIPFVADAAAATGDHGLEMDGNLAYNPSTGTVTSTAFAGNLTGDVTGDVKAADGNIAFNSGATIAASSIGDGVTATTQSASDNSTKIATTAYVDAQVETSDTLSEVLDNGNTTGAFNISVDAGQSIGVDTITETTAAAGVTIDSVLLKDNEVTATTFIGALTGTASKATVTDSSDNTAFPVVFNDESDALLDDTGGFTYNPSSSTVAATTFTGALTGDASGSSGSCTGNSATATLATTVTVTDSTADTAFPVAFHNESNALLDDTGAFTYNPNSSTVSATTFAGALTGDASGSSGSCTGNSATATLATTVTVTDSTADTAFPVTFHNESNALLDDTGAFTYNPSSSTVSATTFAGALTGDASGSSGSCTGNAATATLATTVTVTDSTADTSFPIVFHNESNALLDDTAALTYNPSDGAITNGIWQGTAIDGTYIDIEGTEIKSTSETGGTKFLREDGDGTCSWQTVSAGSGTMTGITPSADTDTATPVEITVAGTLTFTGGTGIDTDLTASSTSGFTVSSALDLSELTDLTNTTFGSANFGAGDHIAVTDASDSNNTKKVKFPVDIGLACSDETSDLSTGTGKLTFRMPHAMTLTEVRASVTTAPTDAEIIVDINDSGTTIMDTDKLQIDMGEKTSTTSTMPATLSDTALGDDAEITVDIDQVGSTVAGAGLKVWLLGYR